MLAPEFLETLPDELVRLMQSLEDEIIADICARIAENAALTGTAENEIRVLQAQGFYLEEIQDAIREYSGLSQKEIDRIFDAAVTEAQGFSDRIFSLADVFPPPDAQALLIAGAAAIRAQVKDDVFNLTQSLGFAVRRGGRAAYLPIAEAYQQALNTAVYAIRSGAAGYNAAIRRAVTELAGSGLRVVTYGSGHADSIDVAARRAVMTGVNQISARYSEFSTDYLETDLVETTAHIGARDKDGPNGWEAHTKWQGRVFRWKKKPRTSTGDYPDFEESTGYGDVTGLCGANCRHKFYPFIEGVSRRTYTDEQLRDLDPPPLEYQGKTYTAYEATQMQRRLERAIRAQEREMAGCRGAEQQEEYRTAQIKRRRLMGEYRAFSEAAGLPVQLERTRLNYKP